MKSYRNVFGYPAMNSEILKEFKDYDIVVGVYPFMKSKKKRSKPTLIVDSFAVLDSCNVPILGYEFDPRLGVYHKEQIRHTYKNKVQLMLPAMTCNKSRLYPDLEILIELADASIKGEEEEVYTKYKARIAKPETSTDKWLRTNYMDYRNARKTEEEE